MLLDLTGTDELRLVRFFRADRTEAILIRLQLAPRTAPPYRTGKMNSAAASYRSPMRLWSTVVSQLILPVFAVVRVKIQGRRCLVEAEPAARKSLRDLSLIHI